MRQQVPCRSCAVRTTRRETGKVRRRFRVSHSMTFYRGGSQSARITIIIIVCVCGGEEKAPVSKIRRPLENPIIRRYEDVDSAAPDVYRE